MLGNKTVTKKVGSLYNIIKQEIKHNNFYSKTQ